MPGPWEQYSEPSPAPQSGPWAKYNQEPSPPVFSGSLLPFSRDASGKVSFDSNAGIFGSIKRAVTLPGDVASGKVQMPGMGEQIPDDVMGRVLETATVASPVNPAVRSGEAAIPGVTRNMVAQKPQVPTATALKEASDQGYNAARNMGVEVRGSAIRDVGAGIRSELEQDGIIGELAPKTFAILSKIEKPPEGAISTLANIDAVRKALRNAAGDFTNRTEQAAAQRAIEGLDKFTANMPAEAVLAGPAAEAAKVLTNARGNYAAAQRSNKITGELDNAITGAAERGELNAAMANSGQNVDNAIRQRMGSILKSKKDAAGYTPEELAQIERVARGGAGSNSARMIGNLLGGGGGLGAAVTGGMGAMGGVATGNPLVGLLAAAPLAGYGMKKVANALTQKQVNKLDDMLRQRSPLYQDALKNPEMMAGDTSKKAAIARMLMLSQQQQQ